MQNIPQRIKIADTVYTYSECNIYQETLYLLILEAVQKCTHLKELSEVQPDNKKLKGDVFKAMGVLEYFQKRFQHYGELKEEVTHSVYHINTDLI